MEQKIETIKRCPICGSSKLEKAIQTKDFFLSQEDFSISKCRKCGFHFTNPRPLEPQLAAYYKSDQYISHSNSRKGLFAFLYQLVRRFTLKNKYDLISSRKDANHILDIGCATGQFLYEFKKRGWNCSGIEPDAQARAFAQNTYGLKVYDPQNINYYPSHSFDVITMWHVLEHVASLDEGMEDLRRLIKENGIVFIALPNIESWDASYYGKYWAGLDVPRHLYHFSQSNVQLLFQKYGFNLKEVLPMNFDSYYVSLLSEKYKGNFFAFVSAFFIGMYSNFKSKKSKPNTSSLLYVLKPIVV